MRAGLKAADKLTGQLPFERADDLLVEERVEEQVLPAVQLDREFIISHIEQIKSRAEARFGLFSESYPQNSIERENAILREKLDPFFRQRTTKQMFAEPPNDDQLRNLTALHNATAELIPVDSSLEDKIKFFEACIEKKVELSADELPWVSHIRTQGLRVAQKHAAYLTPNEVDLLNDLWRYKSELEESWKPKELPISRRASEWLGESNFCWVKLNGAWGIQARNSKYINSSLLDLANSHYLKSLDTKPEWPTSSQGRRDHGRIINAFARLVSAEITADEFMKPLLREFPPPGSDEPPF